MPSIGDARLIRYHALEGAVSQAWQVWCGFCRQVIVESCSGTTTMSGVVVAPLAPPPSPGRISYVAKQLIGGHNVKPGKECLPHQEPTWGDPQVCIEAIDHYLPANGASLKLGLNMAYAAPEHLRAVRNATAHLTSDGVKSVKKISIYYQGSKISHPLDLLDWKIKGSGENVFLVWLDDLRTMAFEMAQ